MAAGAKVATISVQTWNNTVQALLPGIPSVYRPYTPTPDAAVGEGQMTAAVGYEDAGWGTSGAAHQWYVFQTGSTQTARREVVALHSATDDGEGAFVGELGSIDYYGRSLRLRMQGEGASVGTYQSDFEDAAAFAAASAGTGGTAAESMRGGAYDSERISYGPATASQVRVSYTVGLTGEQSHASSHALDSSFTFDLSPASSEAIVPGSVQFRWMGDIYRDFEGILYRGRTDTAPGTAAGTIDYSSGLATITDWQGGQPAEAPVLQSLWTKKAEWTTASLFFNVAQAPLRAGRGGFVLSVMEASGNILTAQVDAQGAITGEHMRGHIDFARGGVQLQFGDFVADASLSAADKSAWWYSAADVGAVEPGKVWQPHPVDPSTLRYSCVSYVYLPVDVALMGIDPAALPSDGRVAFARPGDTCVIGRNITGDPFTPSAGMTVAVGTPRLSMIQVLDAATGEEVLEGYTCDLDAGTITIEDTTGWPASVRLFARQEVYRQISDVKIDGRVTLTQPVGVDFEAGAVFSTALRQGDRFARVQRTYDQQSWDGVTWRDGLDGNQAAAGYDVTNHPINVTNLGAITERWALRFRANAQDFDLIGQHLGQIASGNINEDFAPQNHAAGAPYFTLKAAGWGSGWQAGNVLFIDTVGAEAVLDLVRCVQPSSPAGVDDSVLIVQRGDVDRPPATSFPSS